MKKYPFFILLLAIYPGLAFLAWNLREVDAHVVLRPLLFSIFIGLIFCAICFLLVNDRPKASLICAVLIIFFFSFGHIALLIKGLALTSAPGTVMPWADLLLFVISLFALSLLARAILKTRRDLAPVYRSLNILSLFLILSSSGMLIYRAFGQVDSMPPPQKTSTNPGVGPDVYYILLDAYGRHDALQSLGFDNSAFLKELEDLGFYVATCSRSNYPQTVVSMASVFNMGYLWEVIPNQGANDRNAQPVYAGILNSRVRRAFEERGYQILVFDSGADWLNWRNVDRFVSPPPKGFFSTQLDPFEYTFLDTTALHPLMTQPWFLRQKYVYHYDRILFALDELPKIAQTEGPKFVYLHLLVPHRPNIFLPDGSMNLNTDFYKKGVGEGINRQYDIEGYVNNTKFINSRLPEILREILRASERPPVIVIQGDHGYQLPDIRFDILNAYFFPDQNYAALYPEITPVNTFRVIFDTYFSENYPLVKDQSINVGINRPYGKKTMKPGPCPG